MDERGFEEILAPNHYFDSTFEMQAAKILPGEYYTTGRDMLLVTVLGSCVAACIRDRISGIGGMNHFMLPNNGQDQSNPLGDSARYGTYAMEILVNQLLKMGARRDHLEAKVFGGGNVLRGFVVANVGERNSKFVLDFLKTENIKLVAQDLMDIYPRKVYFFPKSGRVLVKKLRNVHNDTIIEREKEYSTRLQYSKVEGEVELFT
ncbi:putative chemoreceptor glutamine deamidase CheD 1 [Sulfurimicrobium lacus]|uniref:Probable chemoreceptor glutamine deamidase CheD n=1 Tax=Sulfurimicrobium lacus TaxID=2715678 RepID=A0A6F8VEG3_9PROT|nr:chemoreceptor glutamine deamidase CheD [Sulfurimicrobium lacus]BCB27561.1 putative chemoreceptor glutamine deamidase CheD 1 [Sulfurimicrobium lacus]